MAAKLPVLPSSQQRAVQAPAGVLDPLYYLFLSQLLVLAADRLAASQMVTAATVPTASAIPAGEFRVWKNTATSTVVLAVNDGGVVKTVTLT